MALHPARPHVVRLAARRGNQTWLYDNGRKGVTPGVKTYKIIFLKGSLQVASVIGRVVVTETAAAALPKLTLPQTTGDGISAREVTYRKFAH